MTCSEHESAEEVRSVCGNSCGSIISREAILDKTPAADEEIEEEVAVTSGNAWDLLDDIS